MLLTVHCHWVRVRGGLHSGIHADGADALQNVASCLTEGKEFQRVSSHMAYVTRPHTTTRSQEEQPSQVPRRGAHPAVGSFRMPLAAHDGQPESSKLKSWGNVGCHNAEKLEADGVQTAGRMLSSSVTSLRTGVLSVSQLHQVGVPLGQKLLQQFQLALPVMLMSQKNTQKNSILPRRSFSEAPS